MIITSKKFPYALRHKVALEKPVRVSDGAGGYTITWELVATLWAEIRRLRGNEAQAQGKITASNAHLFTLRFRKDINEEMRFCYNARLFNIRSIHNVGEKNTSLEVYAEEGVG